MLGSAFKKLKALMSLITRAFRSAAPMSFLFLDECSYEKLDLMALTGVLVPVERYNAVRDAICQIVWDVLRPPPNEVPARLELHGNELLSQLIDRDRETLDNDRLAVLQEIVRIVNENRLHVFRIAYLNRKEIAARMTKDPNLYALNAFNMLVSLDRVLATRLVVPVMDGIPGSAGDAKPPPRIDPVMIRAFAGSIRWIHHARRHPSVSAGISINNAENLAEAVFADSAHSTLLQLTDLISHLLLQLERQELEPNEPSEYRKRVIGVAQGFDRHLLHCWREKMNVG